MKPTDGAPESCAQQPVTAAARLVWCRTSLEGAFWAAAPTWLEAALASAVCMQPRRSREERIMASAGPCPCQSLHRNKPASHMREQYRTLKHGSRSTKVARLCSGLPVAICYAWRMEHGEHGKDSSRLLGMGCGQGQANAREARRGAGRPSRS